jgi:hypothetical protein
MHTIDVGRQWAALTGILFLASPVAGPIAAQTQGQSVPAREGAAPTTSTKVLSARGCLRDVSELGGQGSGGQAWQGSIAGHVLTDVQIGLLPTSPPSSSNAPQRTAPETAPSTTPAASSQAPGEPSAPQMLLILGLAESELRKYRGQQVEVNGTVGKTRDSGRAAPSPSGGSQPPGSPASGQSGRTSSPQVGTGGSLRVPPSSTRVTQPPTEFHATSIRGIARSCPSAAR